MTRNTQRFHDAMKRAFEPFRHLPEERVETGCRRVLSDLRDDADRLAVHDGTIGMSAPVALMKWMRPVLAMVVVVAAIVLARSWSSAPLATAVAEGVFELADGSQVEMHPQTELSFERAGDGIRIRLTKGGVIVHAAKQRAGHLYVQTKDVTVSVVGTVFLVDAEEAGSRVAVIEGEVRVQQGATERKLLSGQQLVTSPLIKAPALPQGIAWSRNVEAHVALLQQSAPIASQPPSQGEPRIAFEEVSIRKSAPSSESGARGGGDGGGSGINQWGCGISSPTIDPRRFSVTKTTAYTLIVWAYGSKGLNAPGCGMDSQLNLIAGGPAWIKSELFDVVAVIPEGLSIAAKEQRQTGSDPVLQRMLQAMLAERFGLAVRRETRDVPVYSLSLTRDALRLATPSDPAQWLTQGEGRSDDKLLGGALRDPGVIADTGIRNGEVMQVVRGRNASIADLVTYLGPPMGRTVLDRTGLVGRYNFDFWVAPTEHGVIPAFFRSTPRATSPTIFAALADAGFRLVPSRASLEVLVIQSVEKPSEN